MVVGGADRLLPGPLAGYLGELVDRDGEGVIAARLGMDESRVRRLIGRSPYSGGEAGFVRFDAVDRYLTALDEGPTVDELYGPLAALACAWVSDRVKRRRKCSVCGDQLLEPAERCGFCEVEALGTWS